MGVAPGGDTPVGFFSQPQYPEAEAASAVAAAPTGFYRWKSSNFFRKYALKSLHL